LTPLHVCPQRAGRGICSFKHMDLWPVIPYAAGVLLWIVAALILA